MDRSKNGESFSRVTKAVTTLLFILFLFPFALYIGATAAPDYNALIVRSGSMEPKIPTGSVVYTRPISDYSKLSSGDVITFEDENFLVTHRIQEVNQENGEYFFITKGDANDEIDLEPVSQDRIEGKVYLSIPYFGYLVNFLNSIPGIILLVLIPAILIIWSEIEKISFNLS